MNNFLLGLKLILTRQVINVDPGMQQSEILIPQLYHTISVQIKVFVVWKSWKCVRCEWVSRQLCPAAVAAKQRAG